MKYKTYIILSSIIILTLLAVNIWILNNTSFVFKMQARERKHSNLTDYDYVLTELQVDPILGGFSDIREGSVILPNGYRIVDRPEGFYLSKSETGGIYLGNYLEDRALFGKKVFLEMKTAPGSDTPSFFLVVDIKSHGSADIKQVEADSFDSLLKQYDTTQVIDLRP